MMSKTCFFTGHRRLPEGKIEDILKCLNCEIDKLIAEGVTDFISGGALGFDQIAASLIISKKEIYNNILLNQHGERFFMLRLKFNTKNRPPCCEEPSPVL